jgi:hypothetical protein
VLSLAGVVALVPLAPAKPGPGEPVDRPEKASPDGEERPAPRSVFAGTAIGVILEANGNEVPKNGEQMVKLLEKFGRVAQLPITYSAVDLHTGLNHPRVVLTLRLGTTQHVAAAQRLAPLRPGRGGLPVKPAVPAPPADSEDPNDGLAGLGIPVGAGGVPTQSALTPIKLTQPNLEGRLFLGANLDQKDGKWKVKTFEFISWNSRKQKFDFGFIECDEVEPQIRVVDGVKCFSCHKNKGPILGQGPWSNTTHNDVVRQAVSTSLGINLQSLCLPNTIGQPTSPDAGFDLGIVRNQQTTVDGVSVLIPQGPAVDAAVRQGADMARDRELYRTMLRTQDGRRGAVILLSAIAQQGHLEVTNLQAKSALNNTYTGGYPEFADKFVSLHQKDTSTLIDFNPSGSIGTIRQVTGAAGGWGSGSTLQGNLRVVWSGNTEQVTAYETKRSDGEPGLPSNRQPSNPKAFVRQTVALPRVPSVAVNATDLARLIGLTEGDRSFLAEQLAQAARQVGKPKVTPATLAQGIFSGPQFSELLIAGQIPDREDFKDRFVQGLNDALKAQGVAPMELNRKDYASGPNIASSKDENEIPVVPTTACLHCHEVRGATKSTFNPIPLLAFDPFDATSRDSWVKSTEARKRLPVLVRFRKRLVEDQDMPPEDSAEHDVFRTKSPRDFDAVKDWLDAEIKKARGD